MRRAAWMGLAAGMGLVVVSAQAARAQRAVPVAMESLAQAYLSDGSAYAKAATTYFRAAAARPVSDPQAVSDLRYAGLLYATVGDMRHAAEALDEAGRRALALGDLGTAAEIYTNATYIAARTGARDVKVLAHRAMWLADQEGVSQGERALVRQRVASVLEASE
ncbi:MAG TPA: hypothetical protein VF832_02020 [Longimicrobiales bacterium]